MTKDFHTWWSGYAAKVFHKPVTEVLEARRIPKQVGRRSQVSRRERPRKREKRTLVLLSQRVKQVKKESRVSELTLLLYFDSFLQIARLTLLCLASTKKESSGKEPVDPSTQSAPPRKRVSLTLFDIF